ncbi:MAG: VOC family protein [Vicinamibacteria bacterium]
MASNGMTDPKTLLDHLLIGARTLESGIEWLEAKTGIRAVAGGSHPGLGTWNALASLGSGQYIEIISPDPTQPGLPTFYVPRLRDFVEPRIATWAARGTSLNESFPGTLPEPLSCAPPRQGSRVGPDGVRLVWSLAFPKHREHGAFGGALPFLIEWESANAHPSLTTPAGLSIHSLSLGHPEALVLGEALSALGIKDAIRSTEAPSIEVELNTPKGRARLS